MYQRDYILDEARKFALLLARLLGLKAEGKFNEYEQQFNSILQNEYDIELQYLLELNEDEFITAVTKTEFSKEKLNALSQMLYVFAEPFEATAETAIILKKVLAIFDILEKEYHYHSFENIEKRNAIYRFFTNNYE